MNTDSLYFYREGRARPLTILTDHLDGWSLEIASPSMDWVTADVMSGFKNSKDSVSGTCTDIQSLVEQYRKGYIVVKAGRIKRYIKIYQENEPELSIEVSPSSLVLRRGAPNPKTVTVSTYLSGVEVYFSEIGHINWIVGTGFPTFGPGMGNLGNYSFQPVAIPAGITNAVNSKVTFYVIKDGKLASAELTVFQLVDDHLINVIQTTYPALGGAGKAADIFFNVESVTTWKVYTVTDPLGIIGQYDNATFYAGNSVYEFTLLGNPTFEQRKATFHVISDDPEFTPREIEITQDFRDPYINFNEATLGLGATKAGVSQTGIVYSNARWKYTRAGNWAGISSVSFAQEKESGSYSAVEEHQEQITFHPVAYAADANTPIAGTVLTAYADYVSLNHSPANQVTNRLIITRTVPVFFTHNSVTASVARAGGNVTVSVNTNAAWTATPADGTARSQAASAYGTKTITNVGNHANNSWNARNVAVTVTYHGSANGGAKNVYQPGYTASAWIQGNGVTSTGGNVIVRLAGDYPYMTFYASGSDGMWIYLAVNANTITQDVTLTIPINNSGQNRHITIGYDRGEIASFTQGSAGYSVGGYILHPDTFGPRAWNARSVCPSGYDLPTIAQTTAIANTIGTNRGENYGFVKGRNYWTKDQGSNKSYSYYWSYDNTGVWRTGTNMRYGDTTSSSTCYVRCILQ